MRQSISINPVILSGNELFCTLNFWAKLQLDDVIEVLLGVGLKFTKLADKGRFTEKNYNACFINGNIFNFTSVEKEKEEEKQVSKS